MQFGLQLPHLPQHNEARARMSLADCEPCLCDGSAVRPKSRRLLGTAIYATSALRVSSQSIAWRPGRVHESAGCLHAWVSPGRRAFVRLLHHRDGPFLQYLGHRAAAGAAHATCREQRTWHPVCRLHCKTQHLEWLHAIWSPASIENDRRRAMLPSTQPYADHRRIYD